MPSATTNNLSSLPVPASSASSLFGRAFPTLVHPEYSTSTASATPFRLSL
jgi:hypothetical protein